MENKNTTYNLGIIQGKAYRILQNHLSNALKPYGLSIPEWKLLGQLCDYGEMKAAVIANNLDIDAPLVTVLVKNLDEKGFLKRKQNKEDKRAVIIKATEKTIQLILELETKVRFEIKQVFAGVTSEEMATYIKVLGIMVKQGKAFMVKKNYLIE